MKKTVLSITMAAGMFVGIEQAQATVIQYRADLTPAAIGASGTGTALLTIDDIFNTILVEVTFSGLSGTSIASHIHCCTATPSTGAAPAAIDTPTLLDFPIGVTSGSYTHAFDLLLADTYSTNFVTNNGGTAASAETALITGLADGRAYINVHTQTFPGGEIGGFFNKVPEPAPIALLGLGLVAFIATNRKRQ